MSRTVLIACGSAATVLVVIVFACLRAASIADDIMDDLRRADRWS
jgi:hypothetical protein